MASVRSAHHAVELANGADDASMVAAVEALAESSAAAAALAESPPAAAFARCPMGGGPRRQTSPRAALRGTPTMMRLRLL